MAVNSKKEIAKEQNKNYLAKDFSSFKAELVTYARNYFVQQNSDFSEASLGGMFVELAAYVGDSMSFFLDYQFNELDPNTATLPESLLSHARNAGVRFAGKAPASVMIKFFIEVPSMVMPDGTFEPALSALPIIRENTTCASTGGITFSTAKDLDFSEKDVYGNYYASSIVSARDVSGNPSSYIMSREVIAVSGAVKRQTIVIGASIPFRTVTLSDANVSEVISIVDSSGNEYYEVDYLTQNTVFKKLKNYAIDQPEVESVLEVVPAGRRFTTEISPSTLKTTVTFGGGDEAQPDDDLIPDPSELALPLYGRSTFKRFSIDPKNLMRTQTLGIAPANTTLTITYRAGGGRNHNVAAESINSTTNLIIDFPRTPTAVVSANVVASIDVRNDKAAGGGAIAQSLEDLRTSIFSSRNEQSRIVTKEDMLSRIYTLPSTFGRVFRASLRKSSRNPLASELFILSRDISGDLISSPDTLKKNLATYLNEFRLISDAIDVLDATVINYGVEFNVVTAPGYNKQQVVASVSNRLRSITNLRFFQIDQPLIEADFINVIINTPGVLSLQDFKFFNRSGTVSGTTYSDYSYDLEANKYKGMIVGPPGSIFEMRGVTTDIIGSAE